MSAVLGRCGSELSRDLRGLDPLQRLGQQLRAEPEADSAESAEVENLPRPDPPDPDQKSEEEQEVN